MSAPPVHASARPGACVAGGRRPLPGARGGGRAAGARPPGAAAAIHSENFQMGAFCLGMFGRSPYCARVREWMDRAGSVVVRAKPGDVRSWIGEARKAAQRIVDGQSRGGAP